MPDGAPPIFKKGRVEAGERMDLAMENRPPLCMGCMNPLPEGRKECGICGYPADGENPPLYLPVGTVLSERYLVGRVLSAGGDLACYIGYDQVSKAPILIREFLPDTLCTRGEDGELAVLGGCEHTYADYLEKFLGHARALARMRDLPAIIPLYDIFDQNHTAYTVQEYCEGISLETRLAQAGGRLRWEEVRPLFMTLMTSLTSLHAAGILHLGICPENILLGTDGKFRLRGFSIAEARHVSTDLKPQLIAGYSAPEQYGFDQSCSEATDVYGLAATIFRTLTGNPPPEGSARARNSSDLFVPTEVAEDLPENVALALFNALQVDSDKRTPSINAFRSQLSAAPAVSALLEDEKPEPAPAEPEPETPEPPKPKNNRTKYAVLIVLAVFLVLLLLAGGVILILFPDLFARPSASSDTSFDFHLSTSSAESQVSSEYVPPEATYAVEDVTGKNYYEEKDKTFLGNMTLEVQYMAYSDQPKGTILDQSPAPESPEKEGTVIKVVISAGPEEVEVPDVSGWKEEHARLYLEALGFHVETVTVAVSDYEKGYVQDTDPAAGTKRAFGDTITLRVSAVEPTEPPTEPPTTAPPTEPAEEESSSGGWQWPW